MSITNNNGLFDYCRRRPRRAINAFLGAPKGDHFYKVTLGKATIYVVENGERGYTAMLPSEY
jgi:hypothetical protein